MAEVKQEAWGASPCPIPTKMVPDFEALFNALDTRGWLVLEPPAIDHRAIPGSGAMESKIVRDLKNWMMNNRGLMLRSRRIGEYRWYLTIGSPCMSTTQRRKA